MAGKRILVIEDDYDVADMLQVYFQAQDFEFFHADNGPDGIEKARQYFPNVILLDVMLPHFDGYEVCRRLRQQSLTKYIPIIFLTQRDNRADRVKGLELGADDYITKPFDVEELRLRVAGSIRRATRISLHEPRTGLPTGALVDDEVQQRQGSPCHELRLGIAGHREYRDVYGFIAADEAFGFAGHCIQQVISSEGTPQDFVGVVDNHFVILTYANHVPALEQQVKQLFAEGVKAFYNFMDVERGGVLVEPDTEREQLVPLMHLETLGVGV
jgi:CheY-like chemotaxis protein